MYHNGVVDTFGPSLFGYYQGFQGKGSIIFEGMVLSKTSVKAMITTGLKPCTRGLSLAHYFRAIYTSFALLQNKLFHVFVLFVHCTRV